MSLPEMSSLTITVFALISAPTTPNGLQLSVNSRGRWQRAGPGARRSSGAAHGPTTRGSHPQQAHGPDRQKLSQKPQTLRGNPRYYQGSFWAVILVGLWQRSANGTVLCVNWTASELGSGLLCRHGRCRCVCEPWPVWLLATWDNNAEPPAPKHAKPLK